MRDHGRLRVAVGDDLEHPRAARRSARSARPDRSRSRSRRDRGTSRAGGACCPPRRRRSRPGAPAASRRPRARPAAPSRAARGGARSSPWPSASAFRIFASVAAPMPGERPQLLALGRRLQLRERRDAELAPDPRRRLRAEPRQPHERRDLAGHLGAPLRERLHVARLDDLDDLRLDRLADVRQLLRLALERELGDRRGRVADPRRRAPVGGDAKRLLAEDLGEVGQLVELVGEIAVARKRRDHAPIIGRPGRARLADARDGLPADVQRARQPRADGARARRADRHRARPRARDRRQLARRHGRDRRRARGRASLGRGAAPSSARTASGRRTSPGSGARSRQGAELVLEIDCDFSHDPKDVPRLIATCEAGADLALGSRWVEGGGTVNWGRGRTFVSRGGSFYARTILGVGVRDLTGGFKCFRRAVLETIDLDAIAAKGYGFQIETTYRALRAGLPGRRDPDHVRRPPRRRVEDGRLDRRRGDAPGAGAALPRAPRPAVADPPHLHLPHGRGHRRDVRRRGARQRDPGDRRVRGALVPAVQGDRAGPDRDRRRRRRARSPRQARHRREPRHARPATASSRSRP